MRQNISTFTFDLIFVLFLAVIAQTDYRFSSLPLSQHDSEVKSCTTKETKKRNKSYKKRTQVPTFEVRTHARQSLHRHHNANKPRPVVLPRGACRAQGRPRGTGPPPGRSRPSSSPACPWQTQPCDVRLRRDQQPRARGGAKRRTIGGGGRVSCP